MMTESPNPTVTVLLPVHDGAEYVRAAIESILEQSWSDFELLVVENGSTDATPEIVSAIAATDRRLTMISAGPVGLVGALNIGLAAARGEFVARMDADDLARPERLATQVAYLRQHPEVAVLGSAYRYVDAEGNATSTRRVVTSPRSIRAATFFGNPIAHPTVMIVPGRVPGGVAYPESYHDAEDFALWLRIAALAPIANIDDELLAYRRHAANVTAAPGSPALDSSCRALVETLPWPDRVTRWMVEGTFNSVQAGVGVVRLTGSILVLNAFNVVRPAVPRRALLARSVVAWGSHVRRRLRRT